MFKLTVNNKKSLTHARHANESDDDTKASTVEKKAKPTKLETGAVCGPLSCCVCSPCVLLPILCCPCF